MSDRIQELIDGIRGKASALHDQLSTERTQNQKLQAELDGLKENVAQRDSKIDELSLKVSELEMKLKTAGEKEVVVAEGTSVSDAQIDELVREIEYCIGQLKK